MEHPVTPAPEPGEPRTGVPVYLRAGAGAGALAAAIGAFMLGAWLCGAAARWSAAGVLTVKTNMALGLMLGGGALILFSRWPENRIGRRAAMMAAGVVLLLGGLTLSEHLASWDLGIDQILATEAPGAAATASPNRMGPPGSTCHTLLGIALLLLGAGRRRIVPWLGVAILLINLVPAVGFLYGIDAFFSTIRITHIAWPTVLAFMALGLGLVLSCPESGPMPLLLRQDAGGQLLRRMLPVAFLVPVGLGFVKMQADHAGWLDAESRTGLLALALVLVFSLILWLIAGRLSEADRQQQRAQEALRQNEERLRLAQGAANVGIWDWHIGSGRIDWTPELERIYGYQPGTFPGHYGGFRDRVHPDDLVDVERLWKEAVEARRSFDYDFRVLLPSGEIRWLNTKGSAIYDSDGRPLRVFGVNVDITARKTAEAALAAVHAQTQCIIDNTTSLVYVLDLEERFVLANTTLAQLLHTTPQHMIGKRRHAFMPSQDADRHEANDRQVIEAGTALEVEEHSHLEGRSITWLTTKFPLRDGQGRIYAVAGFSADISHRKQAEEALRVAKLAAEKAQAVAESASRAKDQFIAALSHELRTPLMPVMTALSMLRQDPRLPEDVRDDLTTVARNLDLEVRLIEDLLDVSRAASGKMHLHVQPIDVAQVLRDAAAIVGDDLAARSQTLTIDTPGAPWLLRGDPARLQQVFWNLFRNASKFSPAQGRITVRGWMEAATVYPSPGAPPGPIEPIESADGSVPAGASRQHPPAAEPSLVVEVTDAGCGIAPEVLPRLFDAFSQDDHARAFGGLGLGLAICKAVVDLHGGSIVAHSDGPGQGATFTVRLPMVPCPPEQAGNGQDIGDAVRPAIAADSARTPVKLRIVLVEDHLDTARMLRRLLMRQGHEVTLAASVAQGVTAVCDTTPDLLISDVGLPDGSGLDLLRRLRECGHDLPAIALSGYGQEEDLRRSCAAGFAEHLVKPISGEGILAATIARLHLAARQGTPAEDPTASEGTVR